MLALVVFIAAAAAAFYCHYRLEALSAMQTEPVMHAQATVTRVDTPMVQKSQVPSEVASQVTLLFTVHGIPHIGGYSIKGPNAAPAVGATEPVVYLTNDPNVFLRKAEYDDLPRQLAALKWMMRAFGLVALALPLVLCLKK